MVYPDGTPKGILEERGVNARKMKADDMRKKLSQYPDFQNQKTIHRKYHRGVHRKQGTHLHVFSKVPL